MRKKRGATLFSGGGGVEAMLADCIDFVHAVEYDPAIAAVYRANHGDHMTVGDVRTADYTAWGQLDYLHASPVCKNFSVAKAGGRETDEDIETAAAVVRCLEATRPGVFTLENVQQYEGSAAYRMIVQWLNHNGYMWHAEVLNAADFGVPQTRRRLILRAVRGALLPTLPPKTRWAGWYEAIEDLIPTLPESRFADWQLKRLPENIGESVFFAQGKYGNDLVMARQTAPACTITANSNQSGLRAFIVSNADTMSIRDRAEPMRAWLVGEDSKMGMIESQTPAMTKLLSSRALNTRAWLHAGRVVKMTPRALARFQSFPDSFLLPEKASLACTVVGNAAPPLLMRAIVRELV